MSNTKEAERFPWSGKKYAASGFAFSANSLMTRSIFPLRTKRLPADVPKRTRISVLIGSPSSKYCDGAHTVNGASRHEFDPGGAPPVGCAFRPRPWPRRERQNCDATERYLRSHISAVPVERGIRRSA